MRGFRPRLREEHAALLDAERREALHRALKAVPVREFDGNAETEYVLALLKALERVGDESAVAYVEPLTTRARQRIVRDAAEACLQSIRARAS